jgi:hypothetical protein
MIEHYTIKFGPAVGQKELEKLLHTGEAVIDPKELHKMKARIEVVGEFEDLKKIAAVLKEMQRT